MGNSKAKKSDGLTIEALPTMMSIAEISIHPLVISAITGVLTAVVTVLLTFRFYRVRDELRSYRALRSEISQNKELAIENSFVIAGDLTNLQGGIEGGGNLMGQFSTTSFDNAKNTGTMLSFSENFQDSLSSHYRELQIANNAISQRLELRAGSQALGGYEQLAMQNDLSAFGRILKVYPPEQFFPDFKSHIQTMTDGEISGKEIANVLESQIDQDEEELSRNTLQEMERSTFDNLLVQVDEEINEYRILHKVI